MNAFRRLFSRGKPRNVSPSEEMMPSMDDSAADSFSGSCEEKTALINQTGQLCSVLDVRYVMTTVDHVPLLVPVESEVMNKWRLNHFIWDKNTLCWHKNFPDGTAVCFDAVRSSESTGYQILFMWMGSKPDKIVLPVNGSALLLKKHAEVKYDISNDSKSLSVMLHKKSFSLSMPRTYWHHEVSHSLDQLESKDCLKLSIFEMLSEGDGVFYYFLIPHLYLDAPPKHFMELNPLQICKFDGNVLQPSSSNQILYLDAPVQRDDSNWQLTLAGENHVLSQCYQFCSDVHHTEHAAHVLHCKITRHCHACLIGGSPRKISPDVSLSNVSVELIENATELADERDIQILADIQNNFSNGTNENGDCIQPLGTTSTCSQQPDMSPVNTNSSGALANEASSPVLDNDRIIKTDTGNIMPDMPPSNVNLSVTLPNEPSYVVLDSTSIDKASDDAGQQTDDVGEDYGLKCNGPSASKFASQDSVAKVIEEAECAPKESVLSEPTDAKHATNVAMKEPSNHVVDDVTGDQFVVDFQESSTIQDVVGSLPTLETAEKESPVEEPVVDEEISDAGLATESESVLVALPETPNSVDPKFSDSPHVEISDSVVAEITRSLVSDDEDGRSVDYKSASEGSLVLVGDGALTTEQESKQLDHAKESGLFSGGELSPTTDADVRVLLRTSTHDSTEEFVSLIEDVALENDKNLIDKSEVSDRSIRSSIFNDQSEEMEGVDHEGVVDRSSGEAPDAEEAFCSTSEMLSSEEHQITQEISDCEVLASTPEPATDTQPSSPPCNSSKLEVQAIPLKLEIENKSEQGFAELSTLLGMFRAQEDVIHDDPVVECLDSLYDHLMKNCPKPACFGSSFACDQGENVYVVPNCKEFRGFAVADDVFAVAYSAHYALLKCKLQNLYILCPVDELSPMPLSERTSVLFCKASLSQIIGANVAYGVLAWNLDEPPVLLHHSCEVHSLTVGIKARMDHISAYSSTNQGVPLRGCASGTNVLPPLNESVLSSLNFSVVPARIVAFQKLFLHVYVDALEGAGHSQCKSENVFLRRVKKNIAKILEGLSMNTNVFAIVSSNELLCVYDELAPGTCIHFCSEHQPTLMVSNEDHFSSFVSSSSDALSAGSLTNSPDHGFAEVNVDDSCIENRNSDDYIPGSISVDSLNPSLDSGNPMILLEGSSEELGAEHEPTQHVEISRTGCSSQSCVSDAFVEEEVVSPSNIVECSHNNEGKEVKLLPENLPRDDRVMSRERSSSFSSRESQSEADGAVSNDEYLMSKIEQYLNGNDSNTDKDTLGVRSSENEMAEKGGSSADTLLMQEKKLDHSKALAADEEMSPSDKLDPSERQCDQITAKDNVKVTNIQKNSNSETDVICNLITESDVINWSKVKSTRFVCSIHRDQLMNNCAFLKSASCKIILPFLNLYDAVNVLKMIDSLPQRKFSVNTICMQLKKPLFLMGRLITHVAVLGFLGSKPNCATDVKRHWGIKSSVLLSDLLEMLSLYLPDGSQNRVVLGKIVMMGQKYGVLRFSIVPKGSCYYVQFDANALRCAADDSASVDLKDCFMKTCFASIRLDEAAPPESEIRFLCSDVLVGSLPQLRAHINSTTDVTLLKHVLFFEGESDDAATELEASSENIWKTEIEQLITKRAQVVSPVPAVEPVAANPTKGHVLDEQLLVVYVSTHYAVLNRKNNSYVIVPLLNIVEWISVDSSACSTTVESLMGKILRVLLLPISDAVKLDHFSITHFGLAAYVTNTLPAILDTVPRKWRSEVNVLLREVEALMSSFSDSQPSRASVKVNATIMYATESNGILSFIDYQMRPQYAGVSGDDLCFYFENKPIQDEFGPLTLQALIGKPVKALVTYRSRLLLLSYETREVQILTLKSFISTADDATASGRGNEGDSSRSATKARLTSESRGNDSGPANAVRKSLSSNDEISKSDVALKSKSEKSPVKKDNTLPCTTARGTTSSTTTTSVSVTSSKTQDLERSLSPVASKEGKSMSNLEVVKVLFDLSVKDALVKLQHLGLECDNAQKFLLPHLTHYVVKHGEFYDDSVLFVTKLGRIILPIKNYFSDQPLQHQLKKGTLSLMCIDLPLPLKTGSVEINSYSFFAYFGKQPACGKGFQKYLSLVNVATLQELVKASCAKLLPMKIKGGNQAQKLSAKSSPLSVPASPARSSRSQTPSSELDAVTTTSTSLKKSHYAQCIIRVESAYHDDTTNLTVLTKSVKNPPQAAAKVKQPKAKTKNKTIGNEPASSATPKKANSIPVSSAPGIGKSSDVFAKKQSPPPAATPNANPAEAPSPPVVAQKRDVSVGKDKPGTGASGIVKNPVSLSVKSRTSATFSKTASSGTGKVDSNKSIKTTTGTNSICQSSKTNPNLPSTSRAQLLAPKVSHLTSGHSAAGRVSPSATDQLSSTATSSVPSARSSARSSPNPVQETVSQQQYMLMPEPWEYLDSAVIVDNYSDFSRLKTKDGTMLMFQPKQCYLYGVSLEGLQLWHVLVQGLPVRYSLQSDESATATPSVARVYVGTEDVSNTPPLILQQFISDWCEEKCVSAADARLLAFRASQMKGLAN